MSRNAEYVVFLCESYQRKKLFELVCFLKNDQLHSVRLGTGIFGNPHCPAGNRGPSGPSEVLFSVGNNGLVKLIELGFLPCPVCKPHMEEGFWNVVRKAVQEKYARLGIEITSADDFGNKLPFDARRTNWEELAPLVRTPNRLYISKGLSEAELLTLKRRFDILSLSLPTVGYYDREAPGRFTEYKIRG